MARKKKHEEHVNHERWLVSYADFITLLFATFTALFAISNADLAKLMMLQKAVNQAFGDSSEEIDGPRVDNLLTAGAADKTGGLIINIIPNKAPAGAATVTPPKPGMEDTEESEGTPLIAAPGGEEAEGFPADNEGAGPEEGVGANEDAGWGTQDQGKEEEGEGKQPNVGAGEKPAANPNAAPTPAPTPTPKPDEKTGEPDLGTPEGRATAEMRQELEKLMLDIDLKDKIDVRQEARGSVISLGNSGFFPLGDARLLPESKTALAKIVKALQGRKFDIRIEGHTDSTPVTPGGRWTSNLQLSMVRASNIVQFMVDAFGFDPARLSGAGFGDTRPIAPNDTPEGRAKNRRVDVVIMAAGAGATAD